MSNKLLVINTGLGWQTGTPSACHFLPMKNLLVIVGNCQLEIIYETIRFNRQIGTDYDLLFISSYRMAGDQLELLMHRLTLAGRQGADIVIVTNASENGKVSQQISEIASSLAIRPRIIYYPFFRSRCYWPFDVDRHSEIFWYPLDRWHSLGDLHHQVRYPYFNHQYQKEKTHILRQFHNLRLCDALAEWMWQRFDTRLFYDEWHPHYCLLFGIYHDLIIQIYGSSAYNQISFCIRPLSRALGRCRPTTYNYLFEDDTKTLIDASRLNMHSIEIFGFRVSNNAFMALSENYLSLPVKPASHYALEHWFRTAIAQYCEPIYSIVAPCQMPPAKVEMHTVYLSNDSGEVSYNPGTKLQRDHYQLQEYFFQEPVCLSSVSIGGVPFAATDSIIVRLFPTGDVVNIQNRLMELAFQASFSEIISRIVISSVFLSDNARKAFGASRPIASEPLYILKD
jgi:hypothetical protein